MYDHLDSCIDRCGSVRNEILNEAKEEADLLVCEVYSDRFQNYAMIDLFETALAYYEELHREPCIIRAARILLYAVREAKSGTCNPARTAYFAEQLRHCYSGRQRRYLIANLRERESAKYFMEKYGILINTDPTDYANTPD